MKIIKLTLLLIAAFIIGLTTNAQIVQIGSGTETTNSLPINGGFSYSYSQQIYTKAQINTSGQITKIYYYFVSGITAPSVNWKIYMGHTTKNSFASDTDWIPVGSMTEVFNGDVTYPAPGSWMEITLSTPFAYDNVNNLVIAVDENTDNWGGILWRKFTSSINTAISIENDVTNINPASPPEGWARAEMS